MKRIGMLVAALTCVGGCAGTFGEGALPQITGAAAVVSLGLDWCQTRHAAETHHGAWEYGMPTSVIIGGHPSPHAVDGYFAVSTVVIIGLAHILPARWRPLVYAGVIAVEADVIHSNLGSTRCGGVGSGP